MAFLWSFFKNSGWPYLVRVSRCEDGIRPTGCPAPLAPILRAAYRGNMSALWRRRSSSKHALLMAGHLEEIVVHGAPDGMTDLFLAGARGKGLGVLGIGQIS